MSSEPKVCDEALLQAITDLKEKLQSIESRDALIKLLTDRQAELDQSVSEAREKIQSAFACLHEAISVREQGLLTQLEEITSSAKIVYHAAMLNTLEETSGDLLHEEEEEEDVDHSKRVAQLRSAAEAIESARTDAVKAALTVKKVSLTFTDTEALSSRIFEFGNLVSEDRLTVSGLECIGCSEDTVDLTWQRDDTLPPDAPVTYLVEAKEVEEDASKYEAKYAGCACKCTVAGLRSGAKYDFRLGACVGGVSGRGLLGVQKAVAARRFAANGMLYCGAALDLCECGGCTAVCGEGDAGCQCTECRAAQKLYATSIAKQCPNDHPLRLKLVADLQKYPGAVYCGVCRGAITREAFKPSQYILLCDACLHFVCPRCLPRVAPFAECPRMGTVANAADIPPVPGPQKWMRPNGSIYCGRRMGPCKCGSCDGNCGPDDGCSCDECVADLRRLFEGADARCSCSGAYSVIQARQAKGGLFKQPACSMCSHAISSAGWEGNQLMLYCSKCGLNICPACAKRKIPLANLPANIYFFYNGPMTLPPRQPHPHDDEPPPCV